MSPIAVTGPGIVTLSLSPPIDFIEDQLGAFKDRLHDMHGLWERFSDVMEDVEQERFRTAGFGEWPPLAPATLADKARHGFPLAPLIRTGELRDSLTLPERAARMWPERMTWGTDVPYAKYHQGVDDSGEPRDYGGRPPRRTVLDLRVPDRRRLEAAMVAWINEAAAETVGRGL
jgi:hypothetical protein